MFSGDLAQSLCALSQETGFLAKGHVLAHQPQREEQGHLPKSSRFASIQIAIVPAWKPLAPTLQRTGAGPPATI
jgi:hypothetical protein